MTSKIAIISLAGLLLMPVLPVLATEVTGELDTGVSTSEVEGVLIVAPTAWPDAGSYSSNQSVTLTATDSSSIHYTTSGTDPTCTTGTTYSGAISVASDTTIEAISCYPNSNASDVASFAYTISSGGGSSGGSAPKKKTVTPTTPTTPVTPVGLACSGPFTVSLYDGLANNADVKRLQEFLISKGHLAAGYNTGGYFGLTTAAVKAYQIANGITPAVGYFGPITMAAVNAECSGVPTTPTTPTTPVGQMTISQLQAELARLIALLAQLQAAAGATPTIPTAPTVPPTTLACSGPFITDLYYGLIDNADVKRLQDFLISKGHLAAEYSTGRYYGLTSNAVGAYQTSKGISPVPGSFGPLTRAAANADCGF